MSVIIEILRASTIPARATPTSFAELEAATLERLVDNPIVPLSYQASTWKGRQTHYHYAIENPANTDNLIMFYGGGSVLLQNYSIGRATGTKANPFTWTDYGLNPVIDYTDYGNGPIIGPHHLRYNSTASRYEMWATTYNVATTTSWQGLYHSSDGFTWTYEGVALGPTGDETFLGDCGIIEEGTTWYMYYTYRTASATLPGIRAAFSLDSGATWTKVGGDVLSIGSPTSVYDGKYIEGLQAEKIGSDYVLIYGSAREISANITYSSNYAHSTSPTSGFTKSSLNPIFENSVSGWDSQQVSTLRFCTLLSPWIGFYQGTNSPGDYNLAFWNAGALTVEL